MKNEKRSAEEDEWLRAIVKQPSMSERQWKRLAWGIIMLLVLFGFLALTRHAGAT